MASSREEEPVAVPPSRLEIELVCSICLKLFQEPHILGCSHSFCLACLKGCIPEGREEGSCPECLSRFQLRQLIYNRSLGKLAEEIRRLRGDQAVAVRRHVCPEHDEPLKLFCSQDEEPICVICRELPRHRGHEFVPTKNAVEGSQLMRRHRCLLQPCRGTYKLPGTTHSHHATTQTENAVHGEIMADFGASTSLAPTACGTTAKQVREMNWTTKETADSPVQERLNKYHSNTDLFEEIATKMRAKGYRRSAEECRKRLKQLMFLYCKTIAQNALSGSGHSVMPFFSELDAIFHGDVSVLSQNLYIVMRSPERSSSGTPTSDRSTSSIVEEHHSSSPPEPGTATAEENQDEFFIPTMEDPDQTIIDEGENDIPVPGTQMEDHAPIPLAADNRSGAGTVAEEGMDTNTEDASYLAWLQEEERMAAGRSKRCRAAFCETVKLRAARQGDSESNRAWMNHLQHEMDASVWQERELLLETTAFVEGANQVYRESLGHGHKTPAPSQPSPPSSTLPTISPQEIDLRGEALDQPTTQSPGAP